MFYRLLHHFQHSIKLTDSADFSIHHSNPSWAKIFPKNHSFLIMIKSYKLHDIMLAFKNLLNTKYRFDLPLRLHWDWDWPIDLPKSVNELSVELLQLEESGISVGAKAESIYTQNTPYLFMAGWWEIRTDVRNGSVKNAVMWATNVLWDRS